MSHLVNYAKVVTLTPPKYKDLKAYVIEALPSSFTHYSLKLSYLVSKHIVVPKPSNVFVKLRIKNEEVLNSRFLSSSVYPLATYAIPYFIEEYEPSWIGLAAFVDALGTEPQICSACLVVRKGIKLITRRPCILTLMILAKEDRLDPNAVYRDYLKLIWNFITTVLSQKLGTRIELLRSATPRARYIVMYSLTKANQETALEIRIPEAHTSIKLRIPIRAPQWSFSDIPPKLRSDLEVAVVKPLKVGAAYAPRGILIVGPPGVGKSVTAEAIASSLGLRIVELRPSIYRSMWYGMTEKALDKILRALSGKKDLLILIDDADFLMGRHISIHETHVSEISILLQYLQQPRRPFVAMTTNSPDLIDPALIRPGRIDVVLFMGYPDREMRKQVIMRCLKRYGVQASEDVVNFLVNITRWFTNAEIDALIRLAASKGSGKLDEESILWARSKFQINESMRRSIQENLIWYSQKFQGIVLSYVPKESEI